MAEKKTTTSKRNYHSPARAQQAAETRRRIVTAATASFTERGYVGTTMQHIAELAGVSVESVHLVGLKHRLLIMAYRDQLAGGGGEWESYFDTDASSVLDIDDPELAIDAWADFLAEALPRTAGLWTALRVAASSSTEAAAAVDDHILQVKDGYRRVMDWAVRVGLLSADADREVVTVSLYITTSSETYEMLVTDWKLDGAAYRAWVRAAIVRCFRSA